MNATHWTCIVFTQPCAYARVTEAVVALLDRSGRGTWLHTNRTLDGVARLCCDGVDVRHSMRLRIIVMIDRQDDHSIVKVQYGG